MSLPSEFQAVFDSFRPLLEYTFSGPEVACSSFASICVPGHEYYCPDSLHTPLL